MELTNLIQTIFRSVGVIACSAASLYFMVKAYSWIIKLVVKKSI